MHSMTGVAAFRPSRRLKWQMPVGDVMLISVK